MFYWFFFLDQCRILAFPSTLFFVGERLINHTIANISVIDRELCEYHCYLLHNCVSVNFYFGQNGGEAHNCELNNSTSKEHEKDLVKAASYVYHRTNVRAIVNVNSLAFSIGLELKAYFFIIGLCPNHVLFLPSAIKDGAI